MTKNHTMSAQQALTLTARQETLARQYTNATTARAAYNIMLEQIDVETQLQDIYNAAQKTPLETVATSIAIHSLKVLARGRKFTDKDGETVYTPANIQAQKLLEQGRNDTTGIIEDLVSAVTLAIWEGIASGTISIADAISPTGKVFPRLIHSNPDDTTVMRSILNVVQHEFYQHQQKHFAHEYRTMIDEDGNESDVMITAAMREYEKSIEYIGETALFESLQITLTDREKAVLQAKLQQKQVERSYTSNGKQKRHFVTRYLTIAEIAAVVGISDMQVRTALANIKIKCEKVTHE